jgi:hypothetical protein
MDQHCVDGELPQEQERRLSYEVALESYVRRALADRAALAAAGTRRKGDGPRALRAWVHELATHQGAPLAHRQGERPWQGIRTGRTARPVNVAREQAG